MQTHDDKDFRRDWLKSLEAKAERMQAAGESDITGGRRGEKVLCEWKANGVEVRKMPDDEHGILRISIGGGGDAPVELNYCVFRGSHSHCVDLLRKALAAMERYGGDEA